MLTEIQIHKEIDLVQNVIERMASNSFKIKAWTIAIVGVVLALAKEIIFPPKDSLMNEPAAIGLSIFLVLVVVMFWYLDGFFLRTEKLYRNLYSWILEYRSKTIDYLYDLSTFSRKVEGNDTFITAPTIICVMFSKTLWPFYIIPFLFVAGLLVYNCWFA
nr:hypothetical protein [Bacteroidota bacterium]